MLRNFTGRIARQAVVIGIAAGFALAGCGGDGAAQQPQTSMSAATTSATVKPARFPCKSHVEPVPEKPLDADATLNVYTVPLSDQKDFNVGVYHRDPGQLRMTDRRVTSWKAPASLSAATEVRVSIAPSQRRLARIAWSAVRSFARSPYEAVYTACSADTPTFDGKGTVGTTTSWGGGFLTRGKKLCLRLQVTELVTGTVKNFTIDFGDTCGT